MMITETYRDIEIVLLEDENKWRFTANGRERTAPTLPKAREYIDNALDELKTKKVKAWKPFEAYYRGYSDTEFTPVTVTSQAEAGRYESGLYFWIAVPTGRGGKPERRKERISNLYAKTPENDKLIAQHAALVLEAEALEEKVDAAKDRIAQISLPSQT